MNIENAACFGFFSVGTGTKWLIQRYLGYKETAPDHQKEKQIKKHRREAVEH